jgi:hypothetical protein
MAKTPGENDFEDDFLKSIGEDEGDKTNGDDVLNDNEGDEGDGDNEQEERSLSEDDDLGLDEGDQQQERQQERQPAREQQQQRRQPQGDQQQQIKDPFDPRARFEDRNGALYLNGQLVAKGGWQRKIFEGFRKRTIQANADAKAMAGRLVQIAEGGKQLMERYKTLEANKNLFEKAEISFDDQREALDFILAYKKDPLAGLKLILTKAQMRGVDIKQLGVAGNSFDPSVITNDVKKLLDEGLKPVREMTAASADAQKVSAEVTGFFDRNPEADQFAQMLPGSYTELANILKKAKATAPNVSLDDHWKALHYELLKQGVKLDGTTTVVKDEPRRQPPRNRRERRARGTYNGSESFGDIGKDILAEIAQANAR